MTCIFYKWNSLFPLDLLLKIVMKEKLLESGLPKLNFNGVILEKNIRIVHIKTSAVNLCLPMSSIFFLQYISIISRWINPISRKTWKLLQSGPDKSQLTKIKQIYYNQEVWVVILWGCIYRLIGHRKVILQHS
jgi:hypothetical protein